jgi:cobalt-zinc-cadmium efflux system membrane fusion protein
MTKKFLLIGVCLVALATGGALPVLAGPGDHAPKDEKHAEGDGHDHGAEGAHSHGEEEESDGNVHLTAEQIAKAKITLVAAGSAAVTGEVRVMGSVTADADRMSSVTTRLPGVVVELPKRLGDTVAAGEVLAVLDSAELADAKAAYLSAQRQEALAAGTLKREEDLWRKKISAEQDYLDARTNAETARISLDAARQRLAALGLSASDIKALPGQNPTSLARLELRAPIAGRITARNLQRGELVAAEKEAFAIADLSQVWVELPVYAADLPQVREGQRLVLKGHHGQQGDGKVIFVAPTIDPATGAARVVAQVDNAEGHWRPGDFASGAIEAGSGQAADITVPASALQVLKGETVVFVRNAEGFEPRVVEIGRRNSSVAEVLFGLFPGDQVASGNTFLLKAEASRGAAAHSHSH